MSTPDLPQTFLAFRVWRLYKPTRALLSLNAPQKRAPWVATALATPEGSWPKDGAPGGFPAPLVATCKDQHKPVKRTRKGEIPHGPVPSRECSCGVYATTGLEVINDYLRPDSPVLGVVELGGRVIPATNGYRAAYARIAAILVIDEYLTLPRQVLAEVAAAYQVPALVPHSLEPADYRSRLALGRSLGEEAEAWLRERGPLS